MSPTLPGSDVHVRKKGRRNLEFELDEEKTADKLIKSIDISKKVEKIILTSCRDVKMDIRVTDINLMIFFHR